MTDLRANKPKRNSNFFITNLLFVKNTPCGEKQFIMKKNLKPIVRINLLFYHFITNPNFPFVLEFAKTCYDFVCLMFPELPSLP